MWQCRLSGDKAAALTGDRVGLSGLDNTHGGSKADDTKNPAITDAEVVAEAPVEEATDTATEETKEA